MNIIDQLAVFGVRHLQITGGEPLLRDDFLEVLDYARKRGMVISFTSNGYFIDENKARSIANIGVSLIQVSIDGTKDVHNYIRQDEESFDRAINAIKLLKHYSDHQISVATTVMPQNIHSLIELRRKLAGLNIDLWNIGIVMPVGKAKDNPSLLLSKEQFSNLMRFVVDAKKLINIEVGENFPFLGTWEKLVRQTPKICPIGIISCCIGASGYIRGCSDQPDTDYYRVGNIKVDLFREIWSRAFKRYRSRDIMTVDNKCSKCNNKDDCYGGCWVMRENNSHCILSY